MRLSSSAGVEHRFVRESAVGIPSRFVTPFSKGIEDQAKEAEASPPSSYD